MSAARSLPIVGTAIAAWRDAFAAIGRMKLLFLITAVALVVLTGFSPGNALLNVAGVLALVLIPCPFAIAIQRYVLLKEPPTTSYRAPNFPRLRRFIGYLFLVYVSTLVVFVVLLAGLNRWLGESISALLAVILLIPVLVVMVRSVILFPALATDAPHAGWRNAIRDSKGHTWSMFLAMFCLVLPVVALGALLEHFLNSTVISSITGTLLVAAMASLAAHFYAAYADQLGRSPNIRFEPGGERSRRWHVLVPLAVVVFIVVDIGISMSRDPYMRGIFYESGIGVRQDYVQAYKWFQIAGTPNGQARVASKMTSDQIAEAERHAQEWLAAHPKP
jgi:hypothetical protein